MKGVIWQISPTTQIADITHLIPPQDIFAGSYLLARTVLYYPKKTVHIAVVDPGVGTPRRPLAARIGDQFFVGPDNGLITFWVQQAQEKNLACHYFHLTEKTYWLDHVSRVFHGRDIFAPVGAHLCRGVPLEALGEEIFDPVWLPLPPVQETADTLLGSVIQIDHFGNLTTNLSEQRLHGKKILKTLYKNLDFGPLAQSFGEKAPGEWVAIIDSFNHLSLSQVNGNAATALDARVGDPVTVCFKTI